MYQRCVGFFCDKRHQLIKAPVSFKQSFRIQGTVQEDKVSEIFKMDCQATGNPKTGQAAAQCGVMVGDDLANARAGVFASTPGTGGPVTKGVYGAVNA